MTSFLPGAPTRRLVSACVVALGLAACGGGSSGPTASTSSTTSTTSASSSTSGTGVATSPAASVSSTSTGAGSGTASVNPAGLFPDQDTPLTSASESLKAVWNDLNVTVVPGKAAVANIPKAPLVTLIGIDQATAQAVADGFMRNAALLQWSVDNAQTGLWQFLAVDGAFQGPEFAAAVGGQKAAIPACDFFPAVIGVVRVPADVLSQLTSGAGFTTATSTGLVVRYSCSVGSVTGRQVTTGPAGNALLTVSLKTDPALGSYSFIESGVDCEAPRVPAAHALCASVGG